MQTRLVSAALVLLLACATSAASITQQGTCAIQTLFIGGEGCTRPEGAPDASPAIAAACRAGQANLELGLAYALQCCPNTCWVSIGTNPPVQFPRTAPQCANCPAVISAGAGCNEISCNSNFCTVETSISVLCPEGSPPSPPPPPMTPPPIAPPPISPPAMTPPPMVPPPKHKHKHSFTGPWFRKHQALIEKLRKRKEALLAELADIDHHMG